MLETQGLRKAFGGVQAVSNVDLAVLEGDVHALIGPNGAGKTTFFNLLTGSLRPDTGRIDFGGREITALPPQQICRMGIARSFQRASIFPKLSAFENVRVSVLAHEGKSFRLYPRANALARGEVESLLETVGLSDQADQPGESLSHGDRKRLELGIALANRPKLLLLDEPTAGMSPDETRSTMSLVQRLARERGITVLFTEHDMTVVFGIAQRVTVMHQGQVIADGSSEAVRENREVQRVYLGEAGWFWR
ncbi:MAG: ABC transporter ATP-binding protein [Candidatus Rokubacteria bacterium]|nr:ABC transporter ATP-binding protein [Candidatus Rokubacteria bacterium]